MSLEVEVKGLELRYGGNVALGGVDLSVPAGQLHAIIGPNGAGKSSLFSVISGEHRPERGTVWLGGRDVTSWPAHARVRLGLARVFQVARIFPQLTVEENVATAVLAARRRTGTFWRPAGAFTSDAAVGDSLQAAGLGGRGHVLARALAQGDRKRLEVAIALSLDPGVLLLDEPTAGMSAGETEATVALIARLHSERGLTVLLTEHDLDVVFQLAEVLTVLDRGRVIAAGDPPEVRKRPEVIEAYFGIAHA